MNDQAITSQPLPRAPDASRGRRVRQTLQNHWAAHEIFFGHRPECHLLDPLDYADLRAYYLTSLYGTTETCHMTRDLTSIDGVAIYPMPGALRVDAGNE